MDKVNGEKQMKVIITIGFTAVVLGTLAYTGIIL